MSQLNGKKLKLTVFGQSHSKAIGAVIEGLPAGIKLDTDAIQAFLDRRRPGKNKLSTARNEIDMPIILSGITDGVTCGAPLAVMFENSDTRSADYAELKRFPRPSHADYPAFVKHNGNNDIRGGGQFSGRLTAPIVFAGAICDGILRQRGITVGAHVASIGGASDSRFDAVSLSGAQLEELRHKEIPVINDGAAERIKLEILSARNDLDSVGGAIEAAVLGLPAGIGGELFDGVESSLSAALFGIPAVKAVEFGLGTEFAKMRGSASNDPYRMQNGEVITSTNNMGGISGGITNGMPLIFKVTVKPTPSIARAQQTVDLKNRCDAELEIKGRHDPCICIRAVPVVEAVTAFTVLDMLYNEKG